MKANEFRIGNWVTHFHEFAKGGEFIKIEYISKDDDWSDCQPIPLTPEILEKAGFTKVIARKSDEAYVCNGVWVNPRNGGFYSYANSKIEHLHQLQNLYWCLCGEELDVKL